MISVRIDFCSAKEKQFPKMFSFKNEKYVISKCYSSTNFWEIFSQKWRGNLALQHQGLRFCKFCFFRKWNVLQNLVSFFSRKSKIWKIGDLGVVELDFLIIFAKKFFKNLLIWRGSSIFENYVFFRKIFLLLLPDFQY